MGRSEFGRRLEKAIKMEGRPGSIRRFQEQLEERLRGKPGYERFGFSYPAINSYLQPGGPSPSLDWIKEVAEFLGVRRAWLAFEDGEPEEKEDLRRRLFGRDADREVQKAGEILNLLTLGAAEGPFAALIRRIEEAQPEGSPPVSELERMLLAEVIQSTIIGIGNALSGLAGQGENQIGLLGILQGFLSAVPPAEMGRPIEEVAALLPQPSDLIHRKKEED